MTLVNLTSLQTALESPEPILNGAISVTYWAGAGPFVNIDGATITFPNPIRAAIAGGEPLVPLELTPTGGLCCVRWEISSFADRNTVTRYTTIPDVGAVDFGDLPIVDPDTFETTVIPPTLAETIAALGNDLYLDRF